MSLKVPETNEADRSQKRTASDLINKEDKDASSDMEHETLSSCKASMQRRKKHAPSSSSEYSTWSEDEDEADSNCLKSRLASYNSGNFSASELTYKDLLNLNITYEDMPEPLEKFIEEVKDAFRNEKGFTPDPGKITNILKKQLEKRLTFSYDMRKIEKVVKIQHKYRETENVKKEIMENIEMAWKKMDALFDYNALKPATEEFLIESVTLLNVAVRDFAQETLALMEMGKFLEPKYPLIEKERGKRKRRGERSRGGQEWSHGCYDDTRCAHTTENICLHYVRSFGKIFFLKEGYLLERYFTFKNHTVRNTPDLMYHYHCGKSFEELLFIIIEVRKAPFNQDATNIRQLVGEDIMGRVGGELLGQLKYSVFYPSSLGILCMKTKLIFVLLKISKEHSKSLYSGDKGTSEDPGKIMYTEPFDMLKAEDRIKMADFLFWLEFVQDSSKYKFF